MIEIKCDATINCGGNWSPTQFETIAFASYIRMPRISSAWSLIRNNVLRNSENLALMWMFRFLLIHCSYISSEQSTFVDGRLIPVNSPKVGDFHTYNASDDSKLGPEDPVLLTNV